MVKNVVSQVFSYLRKSITKSHLKTPPHFVKVDPSKVPNSVMEALFSNSTNAVKVSDAEVARILKGPVFNLDDFTLIGRIKGKVKESKDFARFYKASSSINTKVPKSQRINKADLALDVKKALFPEAEIKRFVYVS